MLTPSGQQEWISAVIIGWIVYMHDVADPPRLSRLLCTRPNEWPRRRRATEQRDEVAPPHSITSSARRGRIGRGKAERLGGLEVQKQFRFTSPRDARAPNAL